MRHLKLKQLKNNDEKTEAETETTAKVQEKPATKNTNGNDDENTLKIEIDTDALIILRKRAMSSYLQTLKIRNTLTTKLRVMMPMS